MTDVVAGTTSDTALLADRFAQMRAASRAVPLVPWPVRRERLMRLEAMIRAGRPALAQAITTDFGGRPAAETDLAEVFPTLDGISHALRHGAGWMRPRPMAAGRWLWPARASVRPQPLGVVGIVAPWNYPLMLSAGPLTTALVAGNRAMIKLSEHAPAFADAFAALIAAHFVPDEVSAHTGGADMAQAFCALPFDHLLFTGSTATGRKVMAAAAANLTPVTLELGGKSPALIAPDLTAPRLERAAGRVMAGKLLNAGQTCIAPDYALVPAEQIEPFLAAARGWVAAHYPQLAQGRDYTRIINAAQHRRLLDALTEAEAGGARIVPLSDAAPDPGSRLLPPVAVLDAPPGCALLTDEIFGPILPILPYHRLSEATARITAGPRPLAFYPFTDDAETEALLIATVVAGGVTVNDTLLHVAAAGLPFGGVGASGMGAYHGRTGFDRLSHLAPVLRQGRINAAGWIAPPYGARFRTLMRMMIR